MDTWVKYFLEVVASDSIETWGQLWGALWIHRLSDMLVLFDVVSCLLLRFLGPGSLAINFGRILSCIVPYTIVEVDWKSIGKSNVDMLVKFALYVP